MVTTKQENSMTSYIMSLTRLRRRTFVLCPGIGMQKWANMLKKMDIIIIIIMEICIAR